MTVLERQISNGNETAGRELLHQLAERARASKRPVDLSFSADGCAFIAISGPYDLTGAERLSYLDPQERNSRELFIVRRSDGAEVLAAAVVCGHDENLDRYRRLIETGMPVNTMRDALIFGQPDADFQSSASGNMTASSMPRRERLVVIGNGMAGMRTVEELLELAPNFYEITVFGAEPYGNYNRILLSPVLAGEKSVSEIMLNDDAWYAENGITLHKGKEIVRIDRRRRIVVTSDGTEAPYDRLLIATGSVPFMLPIPGRDLQGVLTFRDIHDVDCMLAAATQYDRAVVIGGGLLGLEAANGLMKNGMQVTVIHLMNTLMERQLDAAAGTMLRGSLEARGLFCLSVG